MPDHISQPRALMPERYAGVISYTGDPAATAGFHTINASEPKSNSVSPRDAEKAEPAFAKIDLDAAWGKKTANAADAARDKPLITFDISPTEKDAANGAGPVLCTSRDPNGTSYQTVREDTKLFVLQQGDPVSTEGVTSTIERHPSRSEVTFTVYNGALKWICQHVPAAKFKYRKREWLPSTLSSKLASGSDGGDDEAKVKWVVVKDKYMMNGDRTSTHELVDGDKQRWAEYRGFYDGRKLMGHLHIFKVDFTSGGSYDHIQANVVEQIVVSTLALREVLM